MLALAGSTYAQFTSGVNLVEVYATVTDQRGAPVRDLTAADVRIREDGSPQTITAFTAGDFPLAVAIGLDRSFSMGRASRLDTAKSAARAFIDALKPADQVMVIAIGSAIRNFRDEFKDKEDGKETDEDKRNRRAS